MQMVTCTFCRWASASAPATMALIAARFRYFLLGRSAADANTLTQRTNIKNLNMAEDSSTGECRWPDGVPEAGAGLFPRKCRDILIRSSCVRALRAILAVPLKT